MPGPNDLTPKEMEVLALAWYCMESEPKVDTVKLAKLAGYTPASASVTFGRIKRKLKNKGASLSDIVNTPTTPRTPAAARTPRTPKSGKRSATDMGTEGTPSKKGKKATQPVDEDDEEEFGNFSVKKEEVSDINTGADAFFKDAMAYADRI